MNGLKKIFAVTAAVALVCISSTGAMAANKLIVMDSAGTTPKFVVTDGGRIGLNTSSPATGINIQTTNGTDAQIRLQDTTTNAGDAAGFMILRNNPNGTNSLPQSGNRLAILTFGAMDGSTTRAAAGVFAYASADWDSSSTPSSFTFETTPAGSTTRAEVMRVSQTQRVGIGTSNPAQKLDVAGGIRLNSTGTQPTCSAAIRGTFWLIQGATTDTLQFCAQISGGYAWHTLALP